MKIGDRIEKLSTKSFYKVVDFNSSKGEITLQRLVSGQNVDKTEVIKDLGGYKVIRPKENEISYFDGDYAFLSNFYEHPVEYDGKVYPSNEHAFQAAKSLSDKDRESIKNQPSPSRAKFAGRKVNLRTDWEDVKVDIMYEICKSKFQDEKLKKMLLDTGDQILVEGNTWKDDFWGKCSDNGQNHLGQILMKIRDELRES